MNDLAVQPRGVESDRVTKAWGQYLSGYRWSHACTLTVNPKFSTTLVATKGTFRRFIERLEQASETTVCYFAAFEPTTASHYHVHALLGGTRFVSTKAISQAWRAGHSDVAIYDSTGNAAPYASKSVLLVDSIMSQRMPMRIAPPADGTKR